jgi:hypothetical protein
VPEMPCDVYFEEAEWKALVAYSTKNPVPPDVGRTKCLTMV